MKDWFVKNLNDPWIRDRTFYTFRWVKRSRDEAEFAVHLPAITQVQEFMRKSGIKDLKKAILITSYLKLSFCGNWKGIYNIILWS